MLSKVCVMMHITYSILVKTDNKSTLIFYHLQTSAYPVKPTGNTGEITRSLLEKYYFVSESGYMVRPNYDITDPNSDLFGQGRRPWTQIGGQLRFLCNINPLCLGYTSSGFLKNSTSGLAPQEGVTVYIKVQ